MSDTGKTAAALLLLLLFYLWSDAKAADLSVSCRLRSSCLLPCPFDPGPEVVIHWLHPPDSASSVHSFYHEEDQLGRQLPRYRGRTKLFPDQISKGNASLLLTGVELQDGGRYKCYTSTINGNNEDFLNLEVEAPVGVVRLQDDGSVLTCSSSGVFPRPSVSWTPPSDLTTSVSESESGLFSVNSSVTLTLTPPNEYICNISTEHSWSSATYRRNDEVSWSGSRTVLPCVETESSIKSLVWTFNRTHNILKKTGPDPVFSPGWESRVELGPGSELVLKDLTQDQQGVYSCEVITDLGSDLRLTEVTVAETQTSGASAGEIAGGTVLGLVIVAALVGLGVWRCKKHRKTQKNRRVEYHKAENGSS